MGLLTVNADADQEGTVELAAGMAGREGEVFEALREKATGFYPGGPVRILFVFGSVGFLGFHRIFRVFLDFVLGF
jgi:hypothetical protein